MLRAAYWPKLLGKRNTEDSLLAEIVGEVQYESQFTSRNLVKRNMKGSLLAQIVG